MNKYVIRHEKTGLICTKDTTLHYTKYLIVYISYAGSVNCIKLPIVCCTSNTSFIGKLYSHEKV